VWALLEGYSGLIRLSIASAASRTIPATMCMRRTIWTAINCFFVSIDAS
jgi:hypothetical protein